MSHLQGTDYVGSMVVFEDALAKKSRLPQVHGEVGARQRRLRGHGRGADPATDGPARRAGAPGGRVGRAGRPGRRTHRGARRPRGAGRAPRFAYPPQLLLLDGGKGQLAVGERVLEALGLDRRDRAGRPGQAVRGGLPPRLDPTRSGSPGAPRPSTSSSGSGTRPTASPSPSTASAAGSRMTASVLDGVPGLGPARRTRLLKETGGVRALRAASVEDLRALPWLPDAVADAVFERLHGAGATGRQPTGRPTGGGRRPESARLRAR